MCDQHPSNVKSIRTLIEETEINFKRAGKENRFVGFSVIPDEEIVPLFDAPHLLKGIRNNLLSYNLKFIHEGEEKYVSWKDIEKLYEFDLKNLSTIRMLPELTEQHICKDKIKKMKVSHAAQVFSHRVAATMKWTVKYGKY